MTFHQFFQMLPALSLLQNIILPMDFARKYSPKEREDRALAFEERKALQQALIDRGYNPGPVDGIIGAGTKRALRAWQIDRGLPADGYASAAVLEALTS